MTLRQAGNLTSCLRNLSCTTTALHRYVMGLLVIFYVAGNGALAAPSMDVRVSDIDLEGGTVSITIVVHGLENGINEVREVPIYVDNPYGLAEFRVVENLQVVSDTDLTISYRLRPVFLPSPSSEAYPVRLPFMSAERSWLIGNHVFVTPRLSEDFIVDLRTELPISVTFELPPTLTLYGVPSQIQLHNLHELLSLQFGFGEFDVLAGPSSDFPWEIYLEDGGGLSEAEIEILSSRMAEATKRVAELFGTVPFPRVGMLLVRDNFMSGLEGSYAFQTSLPPKVNLAAPNEPEVGKYFDVLVHELVHTWLPIGLFARDDVWFKEGVTSYYGNVLTAQAGWLSLEHVRTLGLRYLFMTHGDTELEMVALSDPQLWYEEYTSESWRRVTYERGFAVAMLLDIHLREATDNTKSLDNVMRGLCAAHLYGTISRGDLLVTIEKTTGVEVSGFFAEYVDSTYLPTVDEVKEGLERLIAWGVFNKN